MQMNREQMSEQQVHERTEQRFRAFVENANDVVFTLTSDGVFSYVSPRWKEAFGYEIEETLGRSFVNFVHPEDVQNCYDFLVKTIESGHRQSGIEYRVKRKDGTYVWYKANGSIINDSEDDKPTFIGIGRDITERKESEEELQILYNDLERKVAERTADLQYAYSQLIDEINDRCELENNLLASEQRFRIFFEKSSDAIFILNLKKNIIENANEAALTMLMSPLEEVIGKSPAHFSPEFQPDGLSSKDKAAAMMQLAKQNGVHRFEWMHQSAYRPQFPADVALTCVDDGKSPFILATLRDMSERKQIEKQLLLSQKLELVGRFAGGIVHDINNKLSIIMGYALLTEDDLPDISNIGKYMSEVNRAAEFSREMIKQLLTFSSYQAANPQLVDIGNSIRIILHSLTPLVGADIQFELLKTEGLWDIMIDPVQLDQIIMNLAVNARDAMPNGGAITIEVTNITLDESILSPPLRKYGDYVKINFRDTGVGMDSETMEQIFEPFFTTKKVGKGTGLGLATIHNLISHNHGFIDVTSAPQMGTLFSIYFPRHIVE